MAKFDEKRLAAHQQLHDAHQVLRRAASGEKLSAADVDQAIKRALDARAQLQALDREVVNTVTKDLTPEKRARAVLFLGQLERRFGPGPGMGKGHGMMRRGGMGMGMGPGRAAWPWARAAPAAIARGTTRATRSDDRAGAAPERAGPRVRRGRATPRVATLARRCPPTSPPRSPS